MPKSFQTLAEIPAEPVSWLWSPYIPKGSVTVVEGFPGSYKSSVLCDLAARVTTGKAMPLTKEVTAPARVLMLNPEDPVALQQARLSLAGADLSKVAIPEQGWRPKLPDDLAELERLIVEQGTSLVIFDPLASYASCPLSADAATRRLMDNLNAFAQRTGVAIVAVRHWNKSSGAGTIYRAAGSHSITAVVRSELIIGENPNNSQQRILAQLKGNLAPLAGSIVFTPLRRDEGVLIEWGGTSQLTATELIDSVVPRERKALEEAKRILFSILGEGPVAAKVAKKLAADCGVSDATLRRAKAELGVQLQRKGFGPGSSVSWSLPAKDHPAVAAILEVEIAQLADQLCNGPDDDGTVISPSFPVTGKSRDDKADGEDGACSPVGA